MHINKTISSSAYLASAKEKIETHNVIKFENLPTTVVDPSWDKIETRACLSLDELGALKNARCPQFKVSNHKIIHIVYFCFEFVCIGGCKLCAVLVFIYFVHLCSLLWFICSDI